MQPVEEQRVWWGEQQRGKVGHRLSRRVEGGDGEDHAIACMPSVSEGEESYAYFATDDTTWCVLDPNWLI